MPANGRVFCAIVMRDATPDVELHQSTCPINDKLVAQKNQITYSKKTARVLCEPDVRRNCVRYGGNMKKKTKKI